MRSSKKPHFPVTQNFQVKLKSTSKTQKNNHSEQKTSLNETSLFFKVTLQTMIEKIKNLLSIQMMVNKSRFFVQNNHLHKPIGIDLF